MVRLKVCGERVGEGDEDVNVKCQGFGQVKEEKRNASVGGGEISFYSVSSRKKPVGL